MHIRLTRIYLIEFSSSVHTNLSIELDLIILSVSMQDFLVK